MDGCTKHGVDLMEAVCSSALERELDTAMGWFMDDGEDYVQCWQWSFWRSSRNPLHQEDMWDLHVRELIEGLLGGSNWSA